MTDVTVLGANGITVSLQYDAAKNTALAQQLAKAINDGITSGGLFAASDTTGGAGALPAGQTGAFTQYQDGLTVLPAGFASYVDATKTATVFDAGGGVESVLAGTGNLTFYSNSGFGSIAGGGGNNRLLLSGNNPGGWDIALGGGNNFISASNGGNDTISVGATSPGGLVGTDQISLGSGNDLVESSAQSAAITAGAGADTVVAFGDGVVGGGSGKLTFIGYGGTTVLGGTGSETVFGGSGPNVLHGGTGGNNLLVAGPGAGTLFGAANGDQLWSNGSQGQELHAGAGNETLSGVLSTGNDTFFGGTGSDTLLAGGGNDVFVFMKGNAGTVDIYNFQSGDTINLKGFGAGEVDQALKSATMNNGSTSINLSDNTKITFINFNDLNKSNFH
jgi:Ca2+-binding RTX toxin-like protein